MQALGTPHRFLVMSSPANNEPSPDVQQPSEDKGHASDTGPSSQDQVDSTKQDINTDSEQTHEQDSATQGKEVVPAKAEDSLVVSIPNLTPIYEGRTNTVYEATNLSFYFDNDDKKTRHPQCLVVTNMKRKGWDALLQPSRSPISVTLNGKKHGGVSGWLVAITWYKLKLNKAVSAYSKCSAFEGIVACPDPRNSLGITLLEDHLSSMQPTRPPQAFPEEWTRLPKQAMFQHLLEQALNRRSDDVGPGAKTYKSSQGALLRQSWPIYAQREHDNLASQLESAQALASNFQAALQEERNMVASLTSRIQSKDSTLLKTRKELNEAKLALKDAKRQYDSLSKDYDKEQQSRQTEFDNSEAANKKVKKQKVRISELEENAATLKNTLHSKSEKLASLKKEVEKLKSRLEDHDQNNHFSLYETPSRRSHNHRNSQCDYLPRPSAHERVMVLSPLQGSNITTSQLPHTAPPHSYSPNLQTNVNPPMFSAMPLQQSSNPQATFQPLTNQQFYVVNTMDIMK